MESNITVFLALIGLVTTVLGGMGLVLKYLTDSASKKDTQNTDLTNKFIDIAAQTTESHNQLTQAIEANTNATKESVETTKKSSDNLTRLISRALKIQP